ncbi:hypothetical protein [Catellatospora tritici]|uniref:hypothetical protein n=1 Tax=Catellatospora tritici TaxID=2851566 RepID=UPI001C2D7136|nr:hypothetical protein [Catellatospora tritici]MBV1853204.1 hypothetical protein [Catellatospora tritici]
MSIENPNVPVILIIVGGLFLLGAFGYHLYVGRRPDSGTDAAQKQPIDKVAAGIGALFVVGGILLQYFPPGAGTGPGGDPTPSPVVSVTAGAAAIASPSPSPSPLPSAGADCGMVEIHVDQLPTAGPALRVGATVALTGPDPAQGDGRVMWVFVESGGDWYAWLAAIDRKDKGFWVGGVPLGRPDHAEDANIGVRTVHVMLMDAVRSKALAADLNENYRALKAAPEGATDLYTVLVDRVCTHK